MKRTIIMGLGIAAIAFAIWVPTLAGSGFGATAAGQTAAAAASDQAAGLETVGQGHPALLLIVAALTVLAFGLVSVIGAGRRRA